MFINLFQHSDLGLTFGSKLCEKYSIWSKRGFWHVPRLFFWVIVGYVSCSHEGGKFILLGKSTFGTFLLFCSGSFSKCAFAQLSNESLSDYFQSVFVLLSISHCKRLLANCYRIIWLIKSFRSIWFLKGSNASVHDGVTSHAHVMETVHGWLVENNGLFCFQEDGPSTNSGSKSLLRRMRNRSW